MATGGETAAAWDAIGNFNPVVPGYFADPTLKKFGDTYYLYTSTDGIGACELDAGVDLQGHGQLGQL